MGFSLWCWALVLPFLACRSLPKEPVQPDSEAWTQAQAQIQAAWLGRNLSQLSFRDIEGKSFKIKDLRGKVVLLNFWFEACKPCRVEWPSLARIQERYGPKGLQIISLSLDGPETLARFAREKALPFIWVASARPLAEELGLHQYPGNLLLDRQGFVVEASLGASDWDATYTYFMLKPRLEELF